MIINKLNLCMFLAQVCTFNIHGQVNLVWVARAEKLAIRGGVDKQKFTREDAICTFQKIVVIAALS